MSNLSNSATATLIFDDHTCLEVECFSLIDYAINTIYRIHLTLVEEPPQNFRPGSLARIEWNHGGQMHYFPVRLMTAMGKSLELSAPLFLDSARKTRYFHQRPIKEILKILIADYPEEVEIEEAPTLVCDYSQQDMADADSVLDLITSQSAYLLWNSKRNPHLHIQSTLPTDIVHTLILRKYGIESPIEMSVARWRQFPKQKIIELDTQDWLGELGECISHPHFGTLRIIKLSLQKTRAQFPVITVTTTPIDNTLQIQQKPRAFLPSHSVRIQETVDSQGRYQTKVLGSQHDAYHLVPTVTLRTGGWHFPYAKDETVIQQYVDSFASPIILGSLIQGPAKTVQTLRTAGGLSWKIHDQEGMEWLAGHQTFHLSPRKIQFTQARGQLVRRACGSMTSRAAKTFRIWVKQHYSQTEQHSQMTSGQVMLESGQHSFFTTRDLQIKTVGLANWTIGQNAILHGKKELTCQSPSIALQGNLQTEAKKMVIHTQRFECQVGKVRLRLDQEGLTLSARKIRCQAGILTQKAQQTLHANA